MDKKLRTRILIVIVAGLWGYNIYRLMMNYQAKKALEETHETYSAPSFSPMMFNRDSFELILPEVDPFLKKQSQSFYSSNSTKETIITNSTKKVKPKEVKQPEPPKKWPNIKYFGFVRNHDKEHALCLIQINGQTTKLSQGDQHSGIFISRVFQDSVHIVFSGEERTFRKG